MALQFVPVYSDGLLFQVLQLAQVSLSTVIIHHHHMNYLFRLVKHQPPALLHLILPLISSLEGRCF